MMDSNNNWVVSNAMYGPANELLSLNYGNPSMAPFENRTYNNLLQLTGVTYSSAGTGTQMSRTYNYPAGSNNGKISSSVDNVSGESVQYQYDSLNRLLAASTTAGPSPWGQSFTYDGFGNLTGKNVTQGSAPTLSVVVDPTTNRAWGSTYDANGNQLQYAGHTLNYDVENRMVYASGSSPYGTSCYYDAGNRRVVRYDSSAFDQYGNSTSYLVYFNGADGKWVSTYQVTTAVGIGDHGTQANVSAQAVAGGNLYFGSKRLGVYDRLGSAKANSAGFYPYGEDKGTITPNDNWKFATYWRESVTGLDYAVNRWYAPGGGRFLTPDPTTHANVADPQTWSQYGYVAGDPVNKSDPSGLDPDDPSTWTFSTPYLNPFCWSEDLGEYIGSIYTCFGSLQTQGPAPKSGFIHVADPSKTGEHEDRIRTVLNWIKDNLDPDCSAWLTGARDAIIALEGDSSNLDTVLIGHGTFDTRSVAAFTGNNPAQTDLPPGYAITVNDAGAFFLGSYKDPSGQQSAFSVSDYTGGSSQAQAMILLHELAHFTSASGFESDFGNTRAGNHNNQLIKDNCKKTLNAAKYIP